MTFKSVLACENVPKRIKIHRLGILKRLRKWEKWRRRGEKTWTSVKVKLVGDKSWARNNPRDVIGQHLSALRESTQINDEDKWSGEYDNNGSLLFRFENLPNSCLCSKQSQNTQMKWNGIAAGEILLKFLKRNFSKRRKMRNFQDYFPFLFFFLSSSLFVFFFLSFFFVWSFGKDLLCKKKEKKKGEKKEMKKCFYCRGSSLWVWNSSF